MVNGIRIIYSRELNEGVSSMLCLGSRVRNETPEEDWMIYRPKRSEYNNEDDGNGPNILSDENYQGSSQKLRQITQIFIIKVFRTIVFIFIIISTTFRPICLPTFFRCLSNSGSFTELRTTSFIETTGVACSDSVNHNRVQVLSIPVYYSTIVRIEPATFRWLSP